VRLRYQTRRESKHTDLIRFRAIHPSLELHCQWWHQLLAHPTAVGTLRASTRMRPGLREGRISLCPLAVSDVCGKPPLLLNDA